MVPALKSRAKLTRSLPRPEKRWLHYFFKDHKSFLRGELSFLHGVGPRHEGFSLNDPQADLTVSVKLPCLPAPLANRTAPSRAPACKEFKPRSNSFLSASAKLMSNCS